MKYFQYLYSMIFFRKYYFKQDNLNKLILYNGLYIIIFILNKKKFLTLIENANKIKLPLFKII